MSATVLFGINLAAAATLLILLRQSERLRTTVVFHVVGILLIAGLYAWMIAQAVAEAEPGKVPLAVILFGVVAGVLYVPFVGYVILSWVRMLGQFTDERAPSVDMQLEEIEQALRFGQTRQALRRLNALLEAHPDNVRARVLLAGVQLKDREYQRAVGSYRLAMGNTTDPKQFTELVFKVAVILNEHLGDAKEACRELDLIRKRMPDTDEAKKAQEWIVRIMDEEARE
jgi:Tfp pilus assembly protein PilF